MTPEQIKELARLKAEGKKSVDKIVEIVGGMEKFPPDKAREFLDKLKEAAAVFHKRRK